MKSLPETLFVSIRKGLTGEYFVSHERPGDAVEGDGPTIVGKYTLVTTAEVRKRSTWKPSGSSKEVEI